MVAIKIRVKQCGSLLLVWPVRLAVVFERLGGFEVPSDVQLLVNPFVDALIWRCRNSLAWLTWCITDSKSFNFCKVSTLSMLICLWVPWRVETLDTITSVLSSTSCGVEIFVDEVVGGIICEDWLSFSKDLQEDPLVHRWNVREGLSVLYGGDVAHGQPAFLYHVLARLLLALLLALRVFGIQI